MSMRIFVYRPGAIGDTILTVPALAALRHRYPGCELTYAGNSAMLPLLPVEHSLSADDPRLLPLFHEPPSPWPETDLHIVFARQPAGLPGIQRDPLDAVSRGAHVADWLAEAVDPGFEDRVPRLDVPAGQGSPLVIHPGAGSPSKRWPTQRFVALAKELGSPLAVVRGPADPESPVAMEHQLWHDLPLSALASKLKGSGLFIGNDSGITHLAAALRVPTIAVHVSTEPSIWGIRGAHTRRLSGDVSINEAVAAAEDLLRHSG